MRLKPAPALDMIVACCLMGMVDAARHTPEHPVSDWLDADEIEALIAYHRAGVSAGTEEPVLTIGRAVRLIGRLGGHPRRKGDGPPGAEVLWRGLANPKPSPRPGGGVSLSILILVDKDQGSDAASCQCQRGGGD